MVAQDLLGVDATESVGVAKNMQTGLRVQSGCRAKLLTGFAKVPMAKSLGMEELG